MVYEAAAAVALRAGHQSQPRGEEEKGGARQSHGRQPQRVTRKEKVVPVRWCGVRRILRRLVHPVSGSGASESGKN